MACRLYGYYGQASGHDPRVAWPTPEELQEEIEFEREFEPTLQQRWATLKEQKEAELAKRRATLVLTCFIVKVSLGVRVMYMRSFYKYI